MKIKIMIGVTKELAQLLRKLADALCPPQPLIYSVKLEFPVMRIVKADLGDFPGVLRVVAKDSEGNVTTLPDDLIIEGSSDNPSAIQLTPDPTNKFAFNVHVGGPNADGTPAQANLVINVFTADRRLIGTADETFTVTAGEAASISIGKLEFPTLPVEPQA